MSRLGSVWIRGASGSRAEDWILCSISTSNCKALDRNFTCFKLLWSSLQTCRLDKAGIIFTFSLEMTHKAQRSKLISLSLFKKQRQYRDWPRKWEFKFKFLFSMSCFLKEKDLEKVQREIMPRTYYWLYQT